MKLSPESYNVIVKAIEFTKVAVHENTFMNDEQKAKAIKDLENARQEINQIGTY